jgi:threonine synthase
MSFKDFGQQLLIGLINFFCARRKRVITVLCATTGDTGPAAISAVAKSPWLRIICGYPEGQVSRLQELQMTTVNAPNVTVYKWQGQGGDDMDEPIRHILVNAQSNLKPGETSNLCGVNSINIGRIIAQVCHFVYAYLKVVPQIGDLVTFAIPTGAAGNIMAGIMAKEMGLPINFIAAVNDNDIIHRVVQSGEFAVMPMKRTLSEAINIQCPYNFERMLYYLSNQDPVFIRQWYHKLDSTKANSLPKLCHDKLKSFVLSVAISDREMKAAISQYWNTYQYLADPHTAIALAGVLKVGKTPPKSTESFVISQSLIILSTADPVKFEHAIKESLGNAFWNENFDVQRGRLMPQKGRTLFQRPEVQKTVFEQGSNFSTRLQELVYPKQQNLQSRL